MNIDINKVLDDNNKIGWVLKFIGKIGTPTGIVAIFCKILSLQQIDIAIASLITMLITAVILLYHPISRFVPSPIVIIVLIVLTTIFFLGYKNILMKDTGLIKYWKPSSKIIGIMPDMINGTKKEIWFYGTNFHITTVDDRQILINKLSQGTNIRYLIFNPYSPILGIAAKDFDQSPKELFNECHKGLTSILILKERWDEMKKNVAKPGELQIKFYDELPRLRAYIFDPDDENSECFYVPYLHKTNSPELPAFQFKNHENGVFGDYFNSINKLWQSSMSLEKLIEEHHDIQTLTDE